jgi:hypothetical protein
MRPWELQMLVRSIDKRKAGISARASALLMLVATHARPLEDQTDPRHGEDLLVAWPSEATLAAELGTSDRHVRRALDDLADLPGFEVVRGRQHKASRYYFRPATLSGLPTVQATSESRRQPSQTGNAVRSEIPSGIQSEVTRYPEGFPKPSRPDSCDIQTGQDRVQTGQIGHPDRTTLSDDLSGISHSDLSGGSLARTRARAPEPPQKESSERGDESPVAVDAIAYLARSLRAGVALSSISQNTYTRIGLTTPEARAAARAAAEKLVAAEKERAA